MVSAKEVINELLVDVFNHILSIEAEVLKNRGVKLSMTEVHVLEAIKNTEDPTMGNIANKLRITMGTLTTSINVLVRKNFVNRYRDETDRRKVYIKLLEPADEVLKIHDEFHDEMVSSLLKDLDLEKDGTLLKSLENISNYFKQRY